MPTNSTTSAAWRRAEARLLAWFAAQGRRPAAFQRAAWRAWHEGRNGLVHAPTGTGKTLAAAGGPLIDAVLHPRSGLQLLWITPLRSLATDTAQHLNAAVQAMDLPWRVLRRTGDSGSAERARLRRGACELLVTTPESLALLLSYPDAKTRFAGLRGIVVDEWHELVGNKRGTLLQLGLTRLRHWLPELRTWGLSATLGNLDEALHALAGDGVLIGSRTKKRTIIETAVPASGERFPWAGHLGLSQLPRVLDAVLSVRSSLVFANTRSQAELWREALSSVWPEAPETLALHHGSIDPKLRFATEEGLRLGTLRCVVATSSLDLGVDFASVERVIQIGSPKSVARLLQRAGRSGHQPGMPSRILCVPTHLLELAEVSAARRALAEGHLEPRHPMRGCLDVLAQHLLTMALGGGFTADEAYAEITSSLAYAQLPRDRFDAVLAYLRTGGSALASYPEYQKLVETEGRYQVESGRIARMHRLSIGTITSDGSLQVRYMKGARLGSVEESFLSRLRPGDRFLFAGRHLELVRVRDMTAYVRAAPNRRGGVPRWMGGRLPLSGELSDELRRTLAGEDDSVEMRALAGLLDVQRRQSSIPGLDQTLCERTRTREGDYLFVFPFAGRLAHEGLAAVLAYRLARIQPGDYGYAVNDYGLTLTAARMPPLDADVMRQLLHPWGLRRDIRASVNLSELARRQFREIARVAGLVFNGYPAHGKTLRQLQASSGLLFDVLRRHDPAHPLLWQAEREVLDQQLDYSRLRACLLRVSRSQLLWRETKRLSPLAFPLWVERLRGGIANDDWKTRVERMLATLEAGADA
ncbi:ligase-associated DNA damage response DEXH box helicase [Luteibacter sp. UNCMF366Tsu5.1]|uniref:ligase-associated DNA damage response DEXH box helicase n=1 Tax=Luteibacter sp. UNCMF366Tsu5.1 TaxID=1502758 RepID=UPI0009090043|nr:ligase-associated DNA damage response DEXH box helicase [Luteibacter sp. UNCMF366Tsu5.1]SFW19946.1 ATP-dependent helicase Lhr and Lhr-like helicase [Luteibacter sp. UNCMF366Tsu5.1]